jgi:hypothetical protein
MIHGSAVGRAILELTASEVQGADLDTTVTMDGWVTVEVVLVMGGLTEAWIRLYAGSAATPTSALYVAGVKQDYRLTAAGTYEFTVPVAGLKYFRASAQGDAGFAGSFCTVTYRYNDYTTVTQTNGIGRDE